MFLQYSTVDTDTFLPLVDDIHDLNSIIPLNCGKDSKKGLSSWNQLKSKIHNTIIKWYHDIWFIILYSPLMPNTIWPIEISHHVLHFHYPNFSQLKIDKGIVNITWFQFYVSKRLLKTHKLLLRYIKWKLPLQPSPLILLRDTWNWPIQSRLYL